MCVCVCASLCLAHTLDWVGRTVRFIGSCYELNVPTAMLFRWVFLPLARARAHTNFSLFSRMRRHCYVSCRFRYILLSLDKKIPIYFQFSFCGMEPRRQAFGPSVSSRGGGLRMRTTHVCKKENDLFEVINKTNKGCPQSKGGEMNQHQNGGLSKSNNTKQDYTRGQGITGENNQRQV